MKGDMYWARSSDPAIVDKAECGGAVTSLLKFALESKQVDAVLTVKARDGNRYDGIPVLIDDPEELMATAGALHCVSANIARCLKVFLDGAFDLKVGVACKPCDAKAIIELVKRNQINPENVLLIGLNCTGTIRPVTAQRMMEEEFGVDPFDVVGEDIEDGKLKIRLRDGSEKERDLAELEAKGLGRRENCRRCDLNIPTMADIACGKWGAEDKQATFIEVCSERGANFIDGAIQGGQIKTEQPSAEALQSRRAKDRAATELARQWQEKDFGGGSGRRKISASCRRWALRSGLNTGSDPPASSASASNALAAGMPAPSATARIAIWRQTGAEWPGARSRLTPCSR